MANRSRSQGADDAEFEEVIEDSRETAEEQEEKSLDGMLAELRGANNVSVNVYRTGKGRMLTFLFTCAPTDYTLGQLQEKLRDEYDGGEFRVHIREAGRLVANQIIAVEAPKNRAASAPAQNSYPAPGGEFASLLVAMQEGNRQMMMALADQQNRQQETTVSLLTTLLTTLAGREQSAPQQNTLADMLGLLATSKNLFDTGDNRVDSFEMFQKGIEFAQQNSGDRNPITALVDSMGPALVTLAEQAKTLQSSPRLAAGRPAPPSTTPVLSPATETNRAAVANEAAPAPFSDEAPEMNNAPLTDSLETPTVLPIPAEYQKFTNLLPLLLQAAAQDADTEVYANVLLDQVPQPELLAIIGDKNKFVAGLHLLPSEFAPYFEWLEEVRDVTMQIMEDADEEPENVSRTGERDTGDIPDPDDEPPTSA